MVAKEWAKGAIHAAIFVSGCLAIMGCGKSPPVASIDSSPAASDSPLARSAQATNTSATETAAPAPKGPQPDPIVIIQTSLGEVKVQLYVHKAPQTVDNFLRNYANRGFYEQTIFHHVDRNSMIAAGGFTADLQSKPTRAPVSNESNNGLKNTRGTIAMARDPELAHSATSQFFFNLVDNAGLDYVSDESDADRGYCVFGQVLEGLDVLDKIAAQPVAPQGDFPSVPEQPVVIQSIRQIQ